MNWDTRYRVLITNVGIANRTGTEIVAMDLARGLDRIGHWPMIWAPLVDPVVAAPVRAAGIPVVSRFEELPAVPDVIHGHHHLETVEALQRFPRAPAIFVSHSGHWWHDEPPRHCCIRRYVGVDDFCRERLLARPWIARDRIHVVRNAVDMDRFSRRPPLPDRPRRALIFSHYAGPDTHLEPIREACTRAGIAVDTAGSGTGKPCAAPELLLQDYDLVFAKARCAIEAMAVGCAVVLCDTTGLGPMVRCENVAALRRWNFGFRVLDRPFTPELIAEEVQRYDPHDAAEVSVSIRRSARLEDAVEQYLTLYRLALGEPPRGSDSPEWHPETQQLPLEAQAAVRLRFVDAPASVAPRQHFTFEVSLDNRSSPPIAPSAPWPSLLM